MSRNTMTRQHFQLIAETIREQRRQFIGYPGAQTALLATAEDFARRLASTNRGFRREQFLAACDPAEEYKPRRTGSNQHSRASHGFTHSEIASGQLATAYGLSSDD